MQQGAFITTSPARILYGETKSKRGYGKLMMLVQAMQ